MSPVCGIFVKTLPILVTLFVMGLTCVILIQFVIKLRGTFLLKLMYGSVRLYIEKVVDIRIWFWNKVMASRTASAIKFEDVIVKCLTNLYCSHSELRREEKLILDLTDQIKSHMTKVMKHSVLAVNTGSIFERYGKPLSAAAGESHLKSGYDVMFTLDVKQLPIVVQTVDDEYVYLIATSENCEAITKLKENSNEVKLSAGKARHFVQDSVSSLFSGNVPESLTHLSGNSNNRFWRMIDYIITSTLTNTLHFCSLAYWTHPVTVIKGPATNFSMKRLPLNPSELIRSAHYHPFLDLDIILSIDLPAWPESAVDWPTRPRFWPSQAVVASVVATACSVVPKTDPSNDPHCWRLSFSRAEVVLSHHVPTNDRLAFMAVKLYFKERLKQKFAFLRSYHLKTMFYHFLESREKTCGNVNDTIFELLSFVRKHIDQKHCQHYFIKTVNLFDISTSEVQFDFLECSLYIQSTLDKFPLSFDDLFSKPNITTQFCNMFYTKYFMRYMLILLLIGAFLFLFLYLSFVLFSLCVLLPFYLLIGYFVRPLCQLISVNPDTSTNNLMFVILVLFVNRKAGIILCIMTVLFLLDWGSGCRYLLDYRICVKYGI